MNRRRTILVLMVLIVACGLLYWSLQESVSPMKISNPRAVLQQEDGLPFPVYLTLENTGAADRLVGVQSPVGERIMIMGTEGEGGAVIPAGARPSFASDGAHIMVMGTDAELQDGSFVPLVLAFEKAGDVPVRALVSRPGSEPSAKAADDGSAPKMSAHDMHGMSAAYDVPADEPPPELTLSLQQLSGSGGYGVTIETRNFEFHQPDGDMAPHVPGQGHGHLYLNGLKLQRMYGPEAEFGALPPGTYSVRVTLNTNDHRAYAVDGKPVSVHRQIEIPQ